MLKKLIVVAVALSLVAAAVWLYFTPHLTLDRMRTAAASGDARAVSMHIDYPVLRENLKTELRSQLSGAATAGGGALGALAATFAGTLLDPMVDTLIRPENLALLLSGHIPDRIGAIAREPAPASEPELSYDGIDQFVLRFRSPGGPDSGLALVFRRSGLAMWKLSDVDLPPPPRAPPR